MNDNNTAKPSSSEGIRELKIDSTLWATPAKIINLLDFKPEKLSIKTKNNEKRLIKKDMTKSSSLILADELHKPIIKKFNKRKVYSQFKDNIWGVDLAGMQSLSRKNKGIKYLLCAIDLYSKYAFVIPLKDKKGISIVNAFNKIIKQSNRKPNKIWVDQGGEIYNNVFKKWLSDNDIIMYSTYNEGK